MPGPVVDRSSFDSVTSQGLTLGIVSKSTTYTAASTDHTILCDATAGSFTVNLPAAATNTGRVFCIKKINATNTVTVDPSGAETIDGAATNAISTQWASIIVQCNGTAWFITSLT